MERKALQDDDTKSIVEPITQVTKIYKLPWEYSQKDLDKLIEQELELNEIENLVVLRDAIIARKYKPNKGIAFIVHDASELRLENAVFRLYHFTVEKNKARGVRGLHLKCFCYN